MATERLDQDATLFKSGDELKFGLSEYPLLTKKERSAIELKRIAQAAYRTVQTHQIENHNLYTIPTDPLELARVNSRLVARMRREYLEASLFGEVNNDNVVSFDDARARRYNDRREEAA